MGEESFPAIFAVKRADILAQSGYMRREKLAMLEKWQDIYREILDRNQCVSLKTLAVNGSDLIAMGWKPGRELGEALSMLLEQVLEDPARNDREWLLAKAREGI
jgi:tRNA nucleotidyltransferase (CCA-adding enzyme)